MVVNCGVNVEFNAMRVFPPPDFAYPDIQKDKMDFYKKIGCPHLQAKYHPKKLSLFAKLIKEKTQHLGGTGHDNLDYLVKGVDIKTLKTTGRLLSKYLNKMNWKVWEIRHSDVGVKQPEPRKSLKDPVTN